MKRPAGRSRVGRGAARAIAASILVLASAACAAGALAAPVMPAVDPAAALRERYSVLRQQPQHGPLAPGLYLQSVESPHALRGDVYAIVDYSYDAIADAFASPAHWCEALLLHPNVKYCHADLHATRTVLSVAIGRKFDQPLNDAFRAEFAYRATRAADYMKVEVDAEHGPLGTQDYRIAVEFTALDAGHSLMHVEYSYNYGLLASLAMRAYLATSGQDKVGFTIIGGDNDGPPHLVGGTRGAVERNTMRYYLAIDAYLGTLATPAPRRFEDSLERWFTATERYATQLYEMDHDAYVAMKRREYLRQQAGK